MALPVAFVNTDVDVDNGRGCGDHWTGVPGSRDAGPDADIHPPIMDAPIMHPPMAGLMRKTGGARKDAPDVPID